MLGLDWWIWALIAWGLISFIPALTMFLIALCSEHRAQADDFAVLFMTIVFGPLQIRGQPLRNLGRGQVAGC